MHLVFNNVLKKLAHCPWNVFDFNSFPASVFSAASHRQHFWSFLQIFHGPQNILLYEYLKMQKKEQRLRF